MLYQRVSVPSTDGFSLPLDVYCPEVYPEIDPDIQRPVSYTHLTLPTN